jgi:LacI family transcriptional regulator
VAQDLVGIVRDLHVPKVDLAGYLGDPEIPVVEPDYRAMGRMVAEHFLERMFRNYLVVGSGLAIATARLACAELRDTVEARGYSVSVLDTHLPKYTTLPDGREVPFERCMQDDLSTMSRRRLAHDISKAPTPLAVFVPTDIDAVDLVEACQAEGLLIPEQVSIVTISSDVAFCELIQPSLTAVSPDFAAQAYEAAAILDRLMDGEGPPSQRVLTPAGTLVVRESSCTLAVENLDVARALNYIATNYHRPDLYAPDVVAATSLSRRGLYNAFSNCVGHSIKTEIERIRLKRATELLDTGDVNVSKIAECCGYTDTKRLDRSMRRTVGMTPTEYRRKHRVESE